MTTIPHGAPAWNRTGATTPARVAASPSAGSPRLPVGNESRREDGGYLQTVAGGRRSQGLARDPDGSRPTARPGLKTASPRALETIGIHLYFALGLSNEVGPPHGSPSTVNVMASPDTMQAVGVTTALISARAVSAIVLVDAVPTIFV